MTEQYDIIIKKIRTAISHRVEIMLTLLQCTYFCNVIKPFTLFENENNIAH